MDTCKLTHSETCQNTTFTCLKHTRPSTKSHAIIGYYSRSSYQDNVTVYPYNVCIRSTNAIMRHVYVTDLHPEIDNCKLWRSKTVGTCSCMCYHQIVLVLVRLSVQMQIDHSTPRPTIKGKSKGMEMEMDKICQNTTFTLLKHASLGTKSVINLLAQKGTSIFFVHYWLSKSQASV